MQALADLAINDMTIATPPPLVWCGDHRRSHRIQYDVARKRQQISLLLTKNCLVSPLKNVADKPVAPVNVLCIGTIEMPHPAVESGVDGLHHEVIVIGHLVVRVDHKVEPLARGPQNC